MATIVNGVFAFEDETPTKDKINFFLQLASDKKYSDDFAYFLAYVLKYEQENPKFAKSINGILSEFGMENVTEYVSIVDGILNFEYDTVFGTITFDFLFDLFNAGLAAGAVSIPWWVYEALSLYLEYKFGIKLTKDQMENLLSIVFMTNFDMDRIDIKDNGQDIRIESTVCVSGRGYFVMEPVQLRNGASRMQTVGQTVRNFATNIGSQNVQSSNRARRTLITAQEKLNELGNKVNQMSTSLQGIVSIYENAENSVADQCGN